MPLRQALPEAREDVVGEAEVALADGIVEGGPRRGEGVDVLLQEIGAVVVQHRQVVRPGPRGDGVVERVLQQVGVRQQPADGPRHVRIVRQRLQALRGRRVRGLGRRRQGQKGCGQQGEERQGACA